MKSGSIRVSCFALVVCCCGLVRGQIFTLEEATVQSINSAFDVGVLTSERLTQLYLNRIAAYDQQGPALNSIITINPNALATARALDLERRTTGPRSVLHGIPVLLKDQMDTFDMPTTSGSLSLRDSIPPDDAFIVQRLRDAGAVILGKTNLDEFTFGSISASSFGGQSRNAYDTTRVPGGSSGGTAAAIAANFAVVGTGSDAWGSIQEPSSIHSLVGLMPTRMLVSGDGAVPPPSSRRGVTGPMARTVADTAAMLDVIAGEDPADPITAGSAGQIPGSYLEFLNIDGLTGARIGFVGGFLSGAGQETRALMLAAVDQLRSSGAEVVSVRISMPNLFSTSYNDLEYGINRYLETLGPNARFHTLQEIIASGEYLPALEETLFPNLNGDIPPNQDPAYAQVEAVRQDFEQQVLGVMDSQNLDALVYPPLLSEAPTIATAANVWESYSDYRNLNLAPFLGFPSITAPAGLREDGIPFGITFFGRAFSEPTLIRLAYAFEQVTHHRVTPSTTPRLPGETLPLLDFNGDGYNDTADLNLLLGTGDLLEGVTVQAGVNEQYDVNFDGLIDAGDLSIWLAAAAQRDGLVTPYRHGDANLDGLVDENDFGRWNANKFTGSANWDDGNFNGDNRVDVSDFNLWNANKFTSSDSTSAVPEPAAALLMIMELVGLTVLVRHARRR